MKFLENMGWKKKPGDFVVIILLGILFLILAIPVEKKGKDAGSSAGTKYDMNLDWGVEESDSVTVEERKLKDILEKMEGVGEVQVMITRKEKEVQGVLVVARGSGNPGINAKISEVVMALFGLEPHKIKIEKMR